MKKTLLLIQILFMFSKTIYGQNPMDAGFKMLDQGQFEHAYNFFDNYLQKDPTNVTARLCFGRAMGLKGDKEKALQYFKKLTAEYPDNYEIKLNYAESFLWNEKYAEGKIVYTQLIAENPSSFPANLGMANACSNLKEYENAVIFVEKALKIDPNNSNAKISKKYILLGYGFQQSQLNNYKESEKILKNALSVFPNDKEILITLSNLYTNKNDLIKNEEVLSQLPVNPENKLLAMLSRSLIEHGLSHDKKALEWALTAYKNFKTTKDLNLIKSIEERHIQALIWNKKYSEADALIYFLSMKYINDPMVKKLNATLYMNKSQYSNAIITYLDILKQDSLSFDGNLGLANAYFANNELKNSYQTAIIAKRLFPNQLDIANFNRKISFALSPEIGLKSFYSFDLGNDEVYNHKLKLKLPISYRSLFEIQFDQRNTKNTISLDLSTKNMLDIGFSNTITPKISWNITARYIGLSFDSLKKNHLMFLSKLLFKPNAFHNIELSFQQELQDYNTSLMKRNIRTDHYILNYNLSTQINIGFFSQFYYSHYSDQNNRSLLFTSLYYTLPFHRPLKSGINYQHIAFDKSKPLEYFSPNYFNLVEAFAQYSLQDNETSSTQFLCNMQAAVGQQFIENSDPQITFRLQGELGIKFSYNWQLIGYAMYNNIASATAAGGFRYQEFGIRAKYNFNTKIFK